MDVELPFWSRVAYSQLPENLTLAQIARASHSAVSWGDGIIVYGGYQFPRDGYSYFRPLELDGYRKVSDDDAQVLYFVAESGSWDVMLTTSSISSNESIPLIPSPRYGHTAVVYNVRIILYLSIACEYYCK